MVVESIAKSRPSNYLGLFAIGLLLVGIYLGLLVIAPVIPFVPIHPPISAQPVTSENRLIIPKIDVALPINAGAADVLEKGIWHRYPERGNPLQGGNFILSGHRFMMGWTPTQTRMRSPLYNIDKLRIGDTLYVDWGNKRYAYKVTQTYTVAPDQVSIESPSQKAIMTLYSCTKSGASDGRDVIEAQLFLDDSPV